MKPTSLETIMAVKEVLNSSAFKAIKTFSKLNSDQGVMAILPEELAPVLNTLKTLGMGEDVDKITQKIGEISALVVDESSGIMKDAISEVKFSDAVAIVVGGEDAATQVLREAMYGSVKKRYSEKLDVELNYAEVTPYWEMATGTYNLFAKKKVDTNLSDFLAERAVDGVFLAMGKEEKEIRRDPASLGKAVVTKVFDYYKNRKS
jgi:hypothetical protein